jgi:hypothetical protein
VSFSRSGSGNNAFKSWSTDAGHLATMGIQPMTRFPVITRQFLLRSLICSCSPCHHCSRVPGSNELLWQDRKGSIPSLASGLDRSRRPWETQAKEQDARSFVPPSVLHCSLSSTNVLRPERAERCMTRARACTRC